MSVTLARMQPLGETVAIPAQRVDEPSDDELTHDEEVELMLDLAEDAASVVPPGLVDRTR